MNFYSGNEELLGPLYNGVQKAWRSSCSTTDFCYNFTFIGTVKNHI